MATCKHLLKIISLFAAALLLSGCSFFDFGIADLANNAGVGLEGETPDAPVQQAPAVDDVFSLNYDPSQPINPLSSASTINLTFAPLIYEGLFALDENFHAAPTRLLRDCSTQDGVTWYLSVNSGVAMHDGSTLTAEDVRYSISAAVNSPLYGGRLSAVADVAPPDADGVIQLTLKKPDFLFYQRLDIPIIKSGGIGADVPPGTGPYVPNGDKTALTRFSQDPDAVRMPLDTIELKSYLSAQDKVSAFEDSSIDLVVNDPNDLSNLGYGGASAVKYFQTTNMHYLGFNTGRGFFASPTLRGAVTFAVDRDDIVTNLMQGSAVAATLPMNPVFQYYDTAAAAYYNYSPDRCLAALKNGGVDDFDGDGMLERLVGDTPTEVSLDFIVCGDSAVKVSAARAVADSLNSLGLTVNVRELAWDQYVSALENGNFDMYYGEVRLTADFDLTELTKPGGGLNYGGYADAGCDACIAAYLGAGDDERQTQAESMCRYVAEDAPFVPIAFAKQEVITHRGVVTGLTPTQGNVFFQFENWKIDTNS